MKVEVTVEGSPNELYEQITKQDDTTERKSVELHCKSLKTFLILRKIILSLLQVK